MAYEPSPLLIKAKDEYDKAIARYNDWVFNNKNLNDLTCIEGGKKYTATEIISVSPTPSMNCNQSINISGDLQCCKELKFISSDVIPDLIKKFKSFDALAKADPNYNQYVQNESKAKAIKNGIIIIVIAGIITVGIILVKKFKLISKLKSAIKQ